jgi:MoxR-like ATPase
VRAYAVRLVNATRNPASEGLEHLQPYLDLGGSPRASLALIRGGRALAVIRGRNYVMPDDVHSLFHDVLRHRVVLSYEALADDVTADEVLGAVLGTIALPEVPLHERQPRPGPPLDRALGTVPDA